MKGGAFQNSFNKIKTLNSKIFRVSYTITHFQRRPLSFFSMDTSFLPRFLRRMTRQKATRNTFSRDDNNRLFCAALGSGKEEEEEEEEEESSESER